MNIIKYLNYNPVIDEDVFVASGAFVIGQVVIKSESSIWYNCVLRGDVAKIFIGKYTNIQDATVIHVDTHYGDTYIGDNVTVGHSCLLHACTLSDNSFVGMGSIVMDRVEIQEFSMVAAGSLITREKVVKTGELWGGRPAKFMRYLSDKEMEDIKKSSVEYVKFAKSYM